MSAVTDSQADLFQWEVHPSRAQGCRLAISYSGLHKVVLFSSLEAAALMNMVVSYFLALEVKVHLHTLQ